LHDSLAAAHWARFPPGERSVDAALAEMRTSSSDRPGADRCPKRDDA
jgi:hypothetical protein